MRIPFIAGRRREYAISRLTPPDAASLPAIHHEDFPRPWSEEEFASLLSQPSSFGFKAVAAGNPRAAPAGFVLARLAAGEGEIITIAVARAHRRQGLGRRLMDAVLAALHAARAEALFLEVDEGNAAAIRLYRALGFHEVGRRSAYYQSRSGERSSALVMRRDLR
jgi:ribosomal-protein-alanine N-acetyltransferase